MRNLFYIGLLMLGLLSPTFAGDKVGNGGDVVVCQDEQGKIIKIEALDVYEGRVRWNTLPALDKGETPLQKVEEALARLERISPIRAGAYLMRARQFDNPLEPNKSFLDNTILEDIPDSEHLSYPKGCKVEQIIIQKEPHYPEDKRYEISNDLWKLLDNTNKAILMLHEVIYEEALKFGHLNSVHTRYFAISLASNKFESFTPKDMAEFFNLIEFKTFDYENRIYRLGIADNTPNDPQDLYNCNASHNLSNNLPYNLQFHNDAHTIKLGCVVSGTVLIQDKPIEVKGPITFYSTGKLSSANLVAPKDAKNPFTVQIGGHDYEIMDGPISLYKDGHLLRSSLKLKNTHPLTFYSENYEFTLHDKTAYFDTRIQAQLHANGVIMNFIGTYRHVEGWGKIANMKDKVFFSYSLAQTPLEFHSNGYLKKVDIDSQNALPFTLPGLQAKFYGSPLVVYENGDLNRGYFIPELKNEEELEDYSLGLFRNTTVVLPVNDRQIQFSLNNASFEFTFYPGYKPSRAILNQDTTLYTKDGILRLLPKGAKISLDDQGRIF